MNHQNVRISLAVRHFWISANQQSLRYLLDTKSSIASACDTSCATQINIRSHTHTDTHKTNKKKGERQQMCFSRIKLYDVLVTIGTYEVYLARSCQMIQLWCLRLALWWYGEITEIEIGLCVSITNQLMLLGVQECERLWIGSVRVDTHFVNISGEFMSSTFSVFSMPLLLLLLLSLPFCLVHAN